MTNVWLTPRHVVQAVGPFDLDPCAAPDPRPWPTAAVHYTEQEGDGLARPWFGFVWCNPPYRPNPGSWMQRLAEHGAGIGLVFARTEADWFFRSIWERCAGALFLRGRVNFYRPDGTRAPQNGGAPSVLVAYGDEALRRLARASLPGHLVLQSAAILLNADGSPVGTWREAVAAAISGRTLHLRAIYAAAEGTRKVREAKTRGHNWRAQVRRALQVYFRPVQRGVWSAA